jgi:Icc protein
MSASDMTIVHLSELHLQREDKVESGVPYADLLDGYADTLRPLEHLRQYVSQPDLFVVTGDLVLGSRNAEVGYPRLNQLLEQWRAEFDVPILLALGNGDATEPFRRIVLGQTEPTPEKRYYYSQVIKDLKVIVLDSHTQDQHFGDIDEEQLEWLRDELAADPDMNHLLALHHPPAKIVLGRDQEELINAAQLAQVIKGYKVIGILSGHYHLAYLSYLAAIPCVVTNGICSTITWSDPQNMIHERAGGGYNLIHVRDGQMQVRFMDITSERPTLRWEKVEWHKLRPESGNTQ